MNELAKALAEELVGSKTSNDEQTIANYIEDNREWSLSLDLECANKGNRGTTESLLNDFISDVQFYMDELRGV